MISTALLAMALAQATPTTVATAPRWTAIQPGLPTEAVTILLGPPILRQAARGHERWIYDGGCEVQFAAGEVTAWTAPKRKPTTPAPAGTIRSTPPERRG